MLKMSDDETRRRVAVLIPIVWSGKMLCACVTNDRSLLPTKDEIGVEVPLPSIAHTLTRCVVCDEQVWIGPNQALVPDSVAVCYLCAVLADAVAGGLTTVSLDPHADEVPRRSVQGGQS